MAEHTKSYDEYFEKSFEAFLQVYSSNKTFNDENMFLNFCVAGVNDFINSNNEYIENLHTIHKEALKGIGCLFEEFTKWMQEKQNNPISLSQVVNDLNSKVQHSRNSGCFSFLRKFVDFITCSDDNPISMDDVRAISKSFLSFSVSFNYQTGLRNLFEDIDLFLAEHVLIPEPTKVEKETLPNDVMYILQDNLGFLSQYEDDKDHVAQKRVIERLLNSKDVDIVWPDLQNIKQTNSEFFVCQDPDISDAIALKPCLKWEDGILRGEVNIPVDTEEETSN